MRLTNLDPAGTPRCHSDSTRSADRSTHNNYPWGWTMAGNTPFKRWKREVHEGGVADPCIVAWPQGPVARRRAVRHQFTHADRRAAHRARAPRHGRARDHRRDVPRVPLDGVSFAYLLAEDGAADPERHETQYFEMFGSRAIYHRAGRP